MAQARQTRQPGSESGRPVIHTTFFDLMEELAQLTDDDKLVVAAATHLLRSCRVTATRVGAPIELSGNHLSDESHPEA